MKEKKAKKLLMPFRSLPEGKHSFDYHLDSAFISAYESLVEYTGDVDVHAVFFKQDSKQELIVKMEGELETSCDRCLDPMNVKLSSENRYYIREPEEEEEKEDVLFVDSESVEVELSQLFYEELYLNLPQQKKHKKEDCNAEMLAKIAEFKAVENKVDPRWAALENLKKKDK